jgi:stage II sporulation protein D
MPRVADHRGAGRPRRRRLLGAVLGAPVLLIATLAAVIGIGAAPAVAAPTTYLAGPGGTFAFAGHGYGNGTGMSQWGAYGAATQGLTATQILDFYYPGTSTGAQGNPVLRVRITGDEGSDVDVVPSARTGALTVTDHGNANRAMALPATVGTAAVTNWRAHALGNGSTALEALYGGAWHAYPATGQWVSTGSLDFSSATGVVTLVNPDGTERDYPGRLASVPGGAANHNAIYTVNNVPAESYLRSVVPAESPSSWPAAALQAQAIAARSYAANVSNPAAPYDICDTTACQVYNGLAAYSSAGVLTHTYTATSSDAAVSATAGVVRTYGGAPIFAQFGSADGGWTVDGGKPYLVAKADPYDGVVPNSANSWTQNVSVAALGAAFGVGTATSVTALARDGHGEWGGRVTSVQVTGTTGSVTVTGATFAAKLGLRSVWWTSSVVAGSSWSSRLPAACANRARCQ